MEVASGILTSRGGMTSHAAVVTRGMGKCCVAGAGECTVDEAHKELRVKGHTLRQGDSSSTEPPAASSSAASKPSLSNPTTPASSGAAAGSTPPQAEDPRQC